jgi:hypothetical protein
MKRYALILSSVLLFSVIGCGSGNQKVSKKKASLTYGPVIEISETEIDLGAIAPDVEEIVGNIFLFNNGSKPLTIRRVHGSCSCFAGYSGDKLVAPGEGGQIKVKFDKNKIPSGPIKRLVNIETNDPVNSKVGVNFSFNVERSKNDEELRVLQSTLSAMRKDIRTLRSDMAKVLAEWGEG